MPRHTVANSIHRQRYRIVVLAHGSTLCRELTRQLELLNCAVECAETLAAAQAAVDREPPDFLFIDCARFPTRVREIAELFRESCAAHKTRPLLVGMGCDHCPSAVPQVCGLDKYLRLPFDLDDIGALLELPYAGPGAGEEGLLESGQGASISEALSQLPEDVQAAMLHAFVDDTATRLTRIQEHLEEYDLRKVARDVHAVKSGCLQMGFTSMVDCCEEMRQSIEGSDVGGANLGYRALVAAYNVIAGRLPRN